MSDCLVLELPGLPALQNAGARGHWRTRHAEAKSWIRAVAWGVQQLEAGGQLPFTGELPLERARVRLTRYSTREPDCDNLASSFKHILDGIVRAGVIVDDKPSVIGSHEYVWEQTKRGMGRVRVEVWDDRRE